MNSKLLALNSAISAVILHEMVNSKKKSRRRWKIRPLNQNRYANSIYFNLVAEMRLVDKESFIKFHRMDPSRFDQVLQLISPFVSNSTYVDAVSIGEKLSATLK